MPTWGARCVLVVSISPIGDDVESVGEFYHVLYSELLAGVDIEQAVSTAQACT